MTTSAAGMGVDIGDKVHKNVNQTIDIVGGQQIDLLKLKEQLEEAQKNREQSWREFMMQHALRQREQGMTGFEMLAGERARAMQNQMGRQMGKDILKAMPTGGV